MSYEKVKSLTIDYDNLKITLTSASSNVYPIIYYKNTFQPNIDTSDGLSEEDAFIRTILRYIVGGVYDLQRSVSKRLRYAILRTTQKYSNHQLWEVLDTLYSDINLKQDVINDFKRFMTIKDTKDNYVIETSPGKFFVKGLKHGYKYAWQPVVITTSLMEAELLKDRYCRPSSKIYTINQLKNS